MKTFSILLVGVSLLSTLTSCAPTTVQNVPNDPSQPPSNGQGYNFGSTITRENDPTNKHLQYIGQGL